jgi:hypothetical protein
MQSSSNSATWVVVAIRAKAKRPKYEYDTSPEINCNKINQTLGVNPHAPVTTMVATTVNISNPSAQRTHLEVLGLRV